MEIKRNYGAMDFKREVVIEFVARLIQEFVSGTRRRQASVTRIVAVKQLRTVGRLGTGEHTERADNARRASTRTRHASCARKSQPNGS